MPDITMCKGEKCQMKESCFRYLANPSDWQSYFMVAPIKDSECEYFWEVPKPLENNKDPR